MEPGQPLLFYVRICVTLGLLFAATIALEHDDGWVITATVVSAIVTVVLGLLFWLIGKRHA